MIRKIDPKFKRTVSFLFSILESHPFNSIYDLFAYYILQGSLAFALIGFLAGFALFITKGRYNTLSAIATASAITMIVISLWVGLNAAFPIISPLHGSDYIAALVLGAVFSLIILPILLVIYSKVWMDLPDQGYTGQASRDEKVKVWSIRRRQVEAMIGGVVLYACVSFLSFPLSQSRLDLFLIIPPVITILFLGMIYGPWVGLFTGGGGSLLVLALE